MAGFPLRPVSFDQRLDLIRQRLDDLRNLFRLSGLDRATSHRKNGYKRHIFRSCTNRYHAAGWSASCVGHRTRETTEGVL